MPRALAYDPRNALNGICPYFTMFPLEYPLRVLKNHRRECPVVMDPFCGRGTTLFAARTLGLESCGIDSSPIAVAIARAKLCRIDVEGTLQLAKTLIEHDIVSDIPDTEFFRELYTQSVLRKLCAIRTGLLNAQYDFDSIVLLRASMLGCLHGPLSKTPEAQAYFSNQMPRTFASKPDYSVRYWRTKGLKAPEVDIMAVLRRKLSRIQKALLPAAGTFTNVTLGDSRLPESIPADRNDFSLVITSPPYYGMKSYVEDQWLRNWFLGGPDKVEYRLCPQLQHTSKAVFAESLGRVWRNMYQTQADHLHMYVRFGIIPSVKADPRSLIRESLESSGVPWRVVSIRQAATASSGKRQADHMQARSAAATEFDFHICRI